MSEYLIQGETLTAIADAIRSKTDSTETYTPGQMIDLIRSIKLESVDFSNFYPFTKGKSGSITLAEAKTDSFSLHHSLGIPPRFAILYQADDELYSQYVSSVENSTWRYVVAFALTFQTGELTTNGSKTSMKNGIYISIVGYNQSNTGGYTNTSTISGGFSTPTSQQSSYECYSIFGNRNGSNGGFNLSNNNYIHVPGSAGSSTATYAPCTYKWLVMA